MVAVVVTVCLSNCGSRPPGTRRELPYCTAMCVVTSQGRVGEPVKNRRAYHEFTCLGFLGEWRARAHRLRTRPHISSVQFSSVQFPLAVQGRRPYVAPHLASVL